MGLWAGITGTVGKIFGTESAVNRTFNIIEKAGDKAVFTREEKADMHLLFLKAYEPFKVAQRLLAVMFGSAFIFWGSVGLFMKAVGASDADVILEGTVELYGVPVSLILGFYFAGGMLESRARGKIARRAEGEE